MDTTELRRLLSEGTAGEWVEQDDYGAVFIIRGEHPYEPICDVRKRIRGTADDWTRDDFGQSVADARLIAAAINALPALLDVVEAAGAYRAAEVALEREQGSWDALIETAADLDDALRAYKEWRKLEAAEEDAEIAIRDLADRLVAGKEG